MTSMEDLILNGDLAGVQRAVQNDPAKLDARITSLDRTPLMWALHEDSGGQSAIAQWLIQRNAKVDLQDNNGWTALMYACRYDQPETAMALIQRNAKVDLQQTDGWTALMIACGYNQPETAMALIQRNAKVDLQNNNGWTALMFACRNDQPETAMALIQRNAKVDLQNNNGWTALMYACRNDQPETAMALIQRNAKVDLQETDGWTALMLACAQPSAPHDTVEGLLRCVKICYANGADLNLKDSDGRDALAWAKNHNRMDAVAFLEFATASEVAQVLLGEFRQPRSVVVAFYEEDLLTPESCTVLDSEDLAALGVSSPIKRKNFLRRYNPAALQVPRQSLPRRASQRVVRVLRRLSGAYQYDAFLTHDWGEDGANHEIVSSVNARIRAADKVTWFDEERLSGDIVQQITDGIETSRKVVVFITERYMYKLQSRGEDYCKEEFLAAARVRTTRNMVPVVMDPSMLDTSMWRGPLQLKLGGHLFIDFTTPAKREENFPQLLERIGAR